MGRSRSRSPRKKSSRKRSRSRDKRRRRHSSSDSESDHKRRRDKTSTGHRRKSRSRSRDRHKHGRRKRSRSQDHQIRKRSPSPLPVKEKKDLKQEDTSQLTAAEKVRSRLKKLLDQQEKKRKEEEQVVVERILTVPSSAEIAKIDKDSFHQQKFKSAAGSSMAKGMQDKKSSLTTSLPTVTTSSEQDHDNAIFGSELVSLNTTKSPVVQEETVAVSVKQLPSSEKQARWLQKLQKMRSKFPHPPSDEPSHPPD